MPSGLALGSVSNVLGQIITQSIIAPVKLLARGGEKLHFAFKKSNYEITKANIKNSRFVQTAAKVGGAAKGVFSAGLDIMGIFIQLLDKMGVWQPIMDALGLIFQLIGVEAMPALMEGLEELYEVILSMDWSEIGAIVADFLLFLIESIISLLGDPKFMNLLKSFLAGIGVFLKGFLSVLVGFMSWIASLDVGVLKAAVTAMAVLFGFMWGYNAAGGGWAGLAMGIAMAAAAGIAVGMVVSSFAEGGIVTRPTLGLVGEAGKNEAIIPLNDDNTMPGSEELLWATQENGARLDRLTMAIEEQNRIKRFKYL